MASSNLAPDISEKVLGDERWGCIERIAASQHFRGSARLKDFLFYVSDCAIREAPEEATEQQIGIRVFHRHPGYNSSEDSIVRTHARILRQKLTAYYAEEGLHDDIAVEMPKGHYLPVFKKPHAQPSPEPAIAVAAEPTIPAPLATPQPVGDTKSRKWLMAAILLLILLGVAGGVEFWTTNSTQSNSQSAVNRFWHPFFSEDPPLVIFSNALFTGDSTNGLRYAQQQTTQDTQAAGNLVDTYTGIGELTSVYSLTQLFDAHKAHFILKRSLLMTWDEAKSQNLIFIGSTAENPSLRVLESTRDFTMMATPTTAGLVNHHPKPGEPAVYERAEHPLVKDYAILAYLPGVQSGKHMLIFSGLTTFGTQAAVEYMCHQDSVAELLKQVSGPKGEVRPFEAVLETTIGGGVPLETRLVTVRVH
ncbi:hypothetical protein [Silvibacterium acidisoli]|uniref:hypothetical protein n=1 Tax=Acidobacteriaceae bacterium ZG23-2 TaxID=2883246 RepID=UPI00406CFA2C